MNGAPVRPLTDGPGSWFVPLPDEPSARVDLLWRSEPSKTATAGHPIALPDLGGGRVRTALTVRTPQGVVVSAVDGRVAPATAELLNLEVAGWLMSESTESLATIDRSSRRDAEDFVAEVVRFRVPTPSRRAAAASKGTE